MIHRGLLALLNAALTVGAVATAFALGGVRVNASASLPIGLYRITSDTTARLVEFCPVRTVRKSLRKPRLSWKRKLPRWS